MPGRGWPDSPTRTKNDGFLCPIFFVLNGIWVTSDSYQIILPACVALVLCYVFWRKCCFMLGRMASAKNVFHWKKCEFCRIPLNHKTEGNIASSCRRFASFTATAVSAGDCSHIVVLAKPPPTLESIPPPSCHQFFGRSLATVRWKSTELLLTLYCMYICGVEFI